MSDTLHDALARGSSLVQRGQVDEGIQLLVQAAMEVDADPRDYDGVLAALRRAYTVSDRPRGLVSIAWYLGPDADTRKLLTGPPPADVARTHRLLGDDAQAARLFEEAGLLAHAAIAREKAQDFAGARALWSRLSHRLASGPVDDVRSRTGEGAAEQMYVLGLIRYNIARNSPATRADRGRREAIVSSVGALEEAAGRFEVLGLRERAFDCYNALAAIGSTTNTFEHTLEGRVNLIRILREDHLQQYALQQFDESIAVAEGASEYAAAATFAREAHAYARVLGLESDALGFARRAIELHVGTARAISRIDGPPELAENALLAAIGLAADLGLLGRAHALYLEAANLANLDEGRRKRHAAAAERLAGAQDVSGRGDGKPTARPPGPPLEVWVVDVLEWEQGGRAEEACAEILFDAAPSGKTRARDAANTPLRRRALVGRLIALDLAAMIGMPVTSTVPTAGALIRQLGDIVDYRVLSPLEALALHPVPEVRARAVDAAGAMPFKRSAQLLRRAAHDSDPTVLDKVAKAIARKQSPVFVDPLRRLARDAPTIEVRAAALRALATIDNAEAADAVLTALEGGSAAERAAVLEALRRRRPDRNGRLAQAARERLSKGVSPEVARDLEVALGANA